MINSPTNLSPTYLLFERDFPLYKNHVLTPVFIFSYGIVKNN